MRSGLPYTVQRRWFQRRSLDDLLLEQVAAQLRSVEQAVAIAVRRGSAHGYAMQNELLQMADGTLWAASWCDINPPSPVERVRIDYPIDLAAELASLRAEHPARGCQLPPDESRGRIMSLYAATRSSSQWIVGPSRLLGAPRRGALDRIVDALLGILPGEGSS
ncbi:MAG: hypothetical protein U1A78_41475 [Polyangia bacterium]